MTDPRAKFKEALAAFAQPGNRWGGLRGLTYWGAACHMTADEVIEAAHCAGVADRDGEIRSGVASAAAKVAAFEAKRDLPPPEWIAKPRRRRVAPPPPPKVREYIKAGADIDAPEDLRRLSPQPIYSGGYFDYPSTDPLALRVQGELQLLAMFSGTDLVRIRRTKEDNARSRPGENLKPLGEWLTGGGVHPVNFGEVVRVNPLTGKEGLTRDGKPSFDALSCVAAFRHAVLEFDGLPLAEQCRFWAGFIRNSALARRLVSLTFSGGKSIHAVLSLDAPDLEGFNESRKSLVRLFASDPDPKYRLDPQAISPLTGVRLAGARRKDTGKIQSLLYARKEWRDPNLSEFRRRMDASRPTA